MAQWERERDCYDINAEYAPDKGIQHIQMASLDYMMGIAREKATIHNCHYAVVVIDKQDRRVRRVVRLDYVDDPEFAEFDGRVECVIQP